jgi:hypothetical protein
VKAKGLYGDKNVLYDFYCWLVDNIDTNRESFIGLFQGAKKMEHKEKSGMIDNRMVKDNHQEGIARVIQRKGEPGRVGEPGKMSQKGSANWKRSDSAMTPRRG